MAIILISSDLPEVMAMSDRILVMREGRQVAIVPRTEATQERILAAAMGQPDEPLAVPGLDTAAAADAIAVIDALVSGELDPAALEQPPSASGPDGSKP
jgi:ABC-type multidrug transport system ATPase subunit